MQEDCKLGATAAWEVKSDGRIQQATISQRYDSLRAQREADIDARRERLAVLLHADETRLKAELAACHQTAAQRRAAMVERARALAARREAERQQLAQDLLDQAFREGCDPLRERYSRTIVYRTVAERQQQVCLQH